MTVKLQEVAGFLTIVCANSTILMSLNNFRTADAAAAAGYAIQFQLELSEKRCQEMGDKNKVILFAPQTQEKPAQLKAISNVLVFSWKKEEEINMAKLCMGAQEYLLQTISELQAA